MTWSSASRPSGHASVALRKRIASARNNFEPAASEVQDTMMIKPERSWMQFPIRLVIGFGFMAHGWAKLSRGPEGFAKLLHQIGVPVPLLTAWSATFLEILGGAAILIGALVAWVSVPLIAMMVVAMFTIHWRYGFSSINTIGLTAAGPQFGPPGYEVNLLYIAGLLALIVGGPGVLSVDAWRNRSHGSRNAAPGHVRHRSTLS